MGMFDISGTAPGKPMYAEDLYGAGQNLLADQLAPGIKRMTGYESPKRKAMAIADKADLSSMGSIQSTYKQLQQINAGAASAWLKEAMDMYNTTTQRLSAQASYATATGKKPKDRKIVLQNGVQYYADTGERVLPHVADKAEPPTKPSDLPQPTKVNKEHIGDLVDEAYDFGLWDITGKDTEISKESLVDFVFSYSQINNVGSSEVIAGLLNGSIIYNESLSKGNGSASNAPVNPFAVPAIPK